MAITFTNRSTNKKQNVTLKRFVTQKMVEHTPHKIYQIELSIGSKHFYYIGRTSTSIQQRLGEHYRDYRRSMCYALNNASDVKVTVLAVANDLKDCMEIERNAIVYAAKKYKNKRNLINKHHNVQNKIDFN